jgi:glycine oxidase
MRIAIGGAGIVGAAIAYELAMDSRYEITVYDAASGPVAENRSVYAGGTGAALGLLMGAISKREKGLNLRRRLAGVDWYDRVIPELEGLLDLKIPYNRQGILMMQYADSKTEQHLEQDVAQWKKLAVVRSTQNRKLEIWQPKQIQILCPQVNISHVSMAIYSPGDRQVHPVRLTRALISAAEQKGVRFVWNAPIGEMPQDCDVLVVAAGMGSVEIAKMGGVGGALGGRGLECSPVLGQGMRVRMPYPLGNPKFQPVITGDDTHVVAVEQSVENCEYWIGATVEFEPEVGSLDANPEMLEAMWERAIALVPELELAERLHTWQGLRSRPVGRPAPVIEWADSAKTVLLATGHYRNGVLLAPATAIEVREMLGTIG